MTKLQKINHNWKLPTNRFSNGVASLIVGFFYIMGNSEASTELLPQVIATAIVAAVVYSVWYFDRRCYMSITDEVLFKRIQRVLKP